MKDCKSFAADKVEWVRGLISEKVQTLFISQEKKFEKKKFIFV